jgi:ABC-2 type transport system ATP-binding protein
MIEVRNVTKRYGKLAALEDLELKIEKSSVYGLVGYNGAGKTTLLKIMMGIYRPDSGKVLVDGEIVYDNALIRQTMVMVPDEIYFLSQASIAEMSAYYKGFYPRWSNAVQQKLVKVFHLDEKERIARFSKGMQRQAAIVLALSTRPSYLLLDEPFDGLDPVMRDTVRRLILEMIAGTETTVVISSHNLRELEDLCDHIGIIDHRRIVYDNSIEALRAQRVRYRVALPHAASAEDFAALSLKDLVCIGQAATFVARESEAEADEKLRSLNPVLVEKFPLTLEELFLDEMEAKEDDFTGLFDEE